jgi:drug/metabolite transporter (DMT)-like permease
LINKRAIKYYFIAGFCSVAGSNLIFFSAASHVGVSFAALVISLPPILTFLAALTLGMEALSRWRAAGVVFALIGTAILVAAKWSLPETNQL